MLAGFGWNMSERGEEAIERVHMRIAIVPESCHLIPETDVAYRKDAFVQEPRPISRPFLREPSNHAGGILAQTQTHKHTHTHTHTHTLPT